MFLQIFLFSKILANKFSDGVGEAFDKSFPVQVQADLGACFFLPKFFHGADGASSSGTLCFHGEVDGQKLTDAFRVESRFHG